MLVGQEKFISGKRGGLDGSGKGWLGISEG